MSTRLVSTVASDHQYRQFTDAQYQAVVEADLANRLKERRYRGYQIDSVECVGTELDGERIYHVRYTAWDVDEDRYWLGYEVVLAPIGGVLKCLAWSLI
jgi:hypothetical protein